MKGKFHSDGLESNLFLFILYCFCLRKKVNGCVRTVYRQEEEG